MPKINRPARTRNKPKMKKKPSKRLPSKSKSRRKRSY